MVISDNFIGRLPLKIVVPITEWDNVYVRYPWMTRVEPNAVNGLLKTSGADAFQIRSLSLGRFTSKLGNLTDAELEMITDAIVLSVKAKLQL